MSRRDEAGASASARPVGTPPPSFGPGAGRPAAARVVATADRCGVSTSCIGATEGNVRFDIADLRDAGINTYRIFGGMSRWQAADDGVYGYPSIPEIKSDPAVVHWESWDRVMTQPPHGSDYWWSGEPGTTWQGNARTIFEKLQSAGIRPVVSLRNVDNNGKPDWARALNPPIAAGDRNEWWGHVFATVYWLNVRNSYHVDDWEVHNEPDNPGQGWHGSETDYLQFMSLTKDAIDHVYRRYLPERSYRIFAPATVEGSEWPRSAIVNARDDFDVVDVHNYSSEIDRYTRRVREWMDELGAGDLPLWLTEWGTYQGGYDDPAFNTHNLIGNLIRGSRPGPDHIDGSHLFTFFDWDGFDTGEWQDFEGLVARDGWRRSGFYALRLALRGLQGGRTIFRTTTTTSHLMAMTTKGTSGDITVLVSNPSGMDYEVDVDVSDLVARGTARLWEYSAHIADEMVGRRIIRDGRVGITIPRTAAALIELE